MKTIPLTRGKVTIVDDGDYANLARFKWYAAVDKRSDGEHWYAARNEPTGDPIRKQRTIKLHRFLLGATPGSEVDHRDGDGLNNQRQNLRLTDKVGNQRNRGKQSNNTSGFKGVTRSRDRWRAQMKKDGKLLHFGVFDRPEDAAIVYDIGAMLLHGEFAKLNFPVIS